MAKEVIRSEGAPKAIGPYSQAVKVDGALWCSGQIGLDPATGTLVEGGFEAEARQVLANLDAVVRAGGLTLADAVRMTVYVVDLADFPRLNAIFEECLTAPYPARATVQVAGLPKGALVEIDLVAVQG